MMSDEKEKDKKEQYTDLSAIINPEIINNHGDASIQFIKAYKGEEHIEKTLKIIDGKECVVEKVVIDERGLKHIRDYKINPDFADKNIKQQAGFSAEILQEAKTNSENIINNNPNRVLRTDSIKDRRNDEVADIIEFNKDGKIIKSSQMKFKGDVDKPVESAHNVVDDFAKNKKYEKYKDVEKIIPKEQYDEARKYALEKADSLKNEAIKLRKNGKYDIAEKKEIQARDYENTARTLKQSSVTQKEAIEARLNPELSTLKNISEIANNAGLKQGAISAATCGAVLSAKSLYYLASGEKDLESVVKETAEGVLSSGISGYATGFLGTSIKTVFESSSRQTLNIAAKSNAPALIATSIVETGKSLYKYFNHEIDEKELLTELGEKGTGLIASSYGAALGTIVLPGIGTAIGGAVGYMVSSILYNQAFQIFQAEQRSKEIRDNAKIFCEEMIKRIKAEKIRFINECEANNNYLNSNLDNFFRNIELAVSQNNIDKFIRDSNNFIESFGGKNEFSNFEEFDSMMKNKNTIFQL